MGEKLRNSEKGKQSPGSSLRVESPIESLAEGTQKTKFNFWPKGGRKSRGVQFFFSTIILRFFIIFFFII